MCGEKIGHGRAHRAEAHPDEPTDSVPTHAANLSAGSRPARVPVRTIPKINQAVFLGVIFQTDPLPTLDVGTKTEQCSSYVHASGGGHVEDFRGRGGGVGVDCAVCRDDRGLGAIDPPTLNARPGRGPSWG